MHLQGQNISQRNPDYGWHLDFIYSTCDCMGWGVNLSCEKCAFAVVPAEMTVSLLNIVAVKPGSKGH